MADPITVLRTFAERFWPDESALGKIVQTAGRDWQIVGVVETGKYSSLGEDPLEFMYFPYRSIFQPDLTIVARTPGDPGVLLQQVGEAVERAGADLDRSVVIGGDR